jgi:signal transduction histidine kinase
LNPWLEMAWRWFGIEPDLGREIVSQAHAEARQVGAELSIHGRREYSPQPLLALRNEVEDLLQIQAITAAVSADESAGVEPARILSRVLAQGTGCKKYRILAHDAVSHQLVGRTDGADVLQSGSEEADWHIGLKPARSVMAIAFDQGEARLLSAASEPRSVADEQMLDMLGQTAALCLPVIVDPEWGLLIVAGGGHGQMLRLSNQPRYLQTLCSILARVLVGPGGTLSRTRAATRVGDDAGSGLREMTHELSNPLTVASNYLAILEHKLTQADLHYDELAIAKEELQRASRLLADWQLPAKPESRGGKVDVNETLERLVKVYRATRLDPRNISLVLERDEQRALADIDESALQQILRNLIGNAIDAVDDGGHILVKTSAEVFMDSGAFVEIVLIDDGPGLPDAVRANIYNPVESTKGGDHAGLGLSIAKSLIDRENGSIAFRSSAQGTRFQVYLPR